MHLSVPVYSVNRLCRIQNKVEDAKTVLDLIMFPILATEARVDTLEPITLLFVSLLMNKVCKFIAPAACRLCSS